MSSNMKEKRLDLSVIRTNSNWHFKKCDSRFGSKYPGRIPGQIYFNLFFFFTKEQDNILDVFCGGGTGLDVGKLMQRNVVGLDLNPIRKDIYYFDVLTNKNPFKKEVFQLIFLDPPYYDMNRGKYTNKVTDLSNLNLNNFLDAIDLTIKKFYISLKKNGFIALIISNRQKKNGEYTDLSFECEKRLSMYLTIVQKISVPYENTSFQTEEWKNYCIKNKKIFVGTRDLLVFRKKK